MPTIEQLEALLVTEPDDPFLNFGLAMALAKEGRIEDSLGRFGHTIELDSEYVAAYFQKGRVLTQEDRAEEARVVLAKGIEVAQQIGDEHASGEMTEFLATIA